MYGAVALCAFSTVGMCHVVCIASIGCRRKLFYVHSNTYTSAHVHVYQCTNVCLIMCVCVIQCFSLLTLMAVMDLPHNLLLEPFPSPGSPVT